MRKIVFVLISILIMVFFFVNSLTIAKSVEEIKELSSKEENFIKIVYPKFGQNILAKSTFIVGSTHPSASLYINGKEARVFPSGAFVEVVPIQLGKNVFDLTSTLNDELIESSLTLNKIFKNSSFYPPKKQYLKTALILKTIKDEAPIRRTAGGERLTPIKKDILLKAIETQGNYYRVVYSNLTSAWISKNDVEIVNGLNQFQNSKINEIKIEENSKNIAFNISLDKKSPIQLYHTDGKAELILHNTKPFVGEVLPLKSDFLKEIKLEKQENYNKLLLNFNSDRLYGYEYEYLDDVLRITFKKPLCLSFAKNKPLKNKIIIIDAGHGGKEKGSVGPTGVPEKDINLAIALFLQQKLEKKGATVYMTREDDSFVGLYDRVNFAKEKKGDILVSIHNNALPDGKDPYVIHGTSTYYYHNQAIPLARAIQAELVSKIALKDLGIINSSFVITRATTPVSVLVEVGFMINPYEYELLLDSFFQENCAEGILNGIIKYFRNEE